ncbi:hypothetical protein ABPG72_008893 [Tetrahymena utriculariae]
MDQQNQVDDYPQIKLVEYLNSQNIRLEKLAQLNFQNSNDNIAKKISEYNQDESKNDQKNLAAFMMFENNLEFIEKDLKQMGYEKSSISLICAGIQSFVVRAMNARNQQRCVIKCIRIKYRDLSNQQIENQIQQEVQSFEKCSYSSNIVKLIRNQSCQEFTYLVFQECQKNLQNMLADNTNKFSEITVIKYSMNIAQGLYDAQSQNCCVLDLKPENILLDQFGNALIRMLIYRMLITGEKQFEAKLQKAFQEKKVTLENELDGFKFRFLLERLVCDLTKFNPKDRISVKDALCILKGIFSQYLEIGLESTQYKYSQQKNDLEKQIQILNERINNQQNEINHMKFLSDVRNKKQDFCIFIQVEEDILTTLLKIYQPAQRLYDFLDQINQKLSQIAYEKKLEQERLENERLEKEKQEQERIQQEKEEAEKLLKEEQEKIEQQKKAEQERLEINNKTTQTESSIQNNNICDCCEKNKTLTSSQQQTNQVTAQIVNNNQNQPTKGFVTHPQSQSLMDFAKSLSSLNNQMFSNSTQQALSTKSNFQDYLKQNPINIFDNATNTQEQQNKQSFIIGNLAQLKQSTNTFGASTQQDLNQLLNYANQDEQQQAFGAMAQANGSDTINNNISKKNSSQQRDFIRENLTSSYENQGNFLNTKDL